MPIDTDGDGTCDVMDDDDDDDGYDDTVDQAPLDPESHMDTDMDGLGDSRDFDDDGDGTRMPRACPAARTL